MPELGDDAADGVDQPIYFPHDVRCVPGRAGQPDRRDLGHAGVARHRPDDQPGPDHPGVRRHHRPDHSAADPGDRADRAADRGRARAQQAVHRLRNHRDERRRHVAVVPVPRLHVGGDRGVADRDGDQRLFRAQGPAHAARLAHRGARQCGEHHRAARPFHLDRKRRHHPYPRAAQQRPVARHLPRRPAQSGRAHHRAGRRPASCWTTTTAPSWCCRSGIVQRHEVKERDPAMVVFDRYAFDLSQFAGGRRR